MDAFIRMVPDWENLILGVQTGVWAALLGILVAGLVARQLIMYLLPHLLSYWTDHIETVNEFELGSRTAFGAAAAGLVWCAGIKRLAEYSTEGIILPSTYEYWLSAFAELTFAIGLILGAMRMVELVEPIAKWLDKDGVLDGTEQTLMTAVQSIIRFIILIFGVVTMAEAFDFNLTTLLAGLGVGGLALAFAAKDTIGNLFGAVTLLLDRPFKMGDWIVVGSSEGEVVEIGIRTTQIRTGADTIITLPNASLVNKEIENFGKRRWRRFLPVLYLDLDSDSESVEKFCHGIEKLIKTNPKTLKEDDSYALVSAIAKDSVEVGVNMYWNVSGSLEEKQERNKFLLEVAELANQLKLKFYEPRVRRAEE